VRGVKQAQVRLKAETTIMLRVPTLTADNRKEDLTTKTRRSTKDTKKRTSALSHAPLRALRSLGLDVFFVLFVYFVTFVVRRLRP